jgi:hypothetical protein
VPEGLVRVHALFPAHTAVNAYNRLFPAQQHRNALLEVVQRVPMLSEKYELLGGRRFQDFRPLPAPSEEALPLLASARATAGLLKRWTDKALKGLCRRGIRNVAFCTGRTCPMQKAAGQNKGLLRAPIDFDMSRERSPVEIACPDLGKTAPSRWGKARPVPGRKDRPLAHPVGEEDSQMR